MISGMNVVGSENSGMRLLRRRCVTVALGATLLAASLFATASPAMAQCSQQCQWTVVMGKCRTVLGATVPCPLRKKVCGERVCTQRFS